MTLSRSQDGTSLRLSVSWPDGPTEAEVIALLEQLPLPPGQPFRFSMRCIPMRDPRKPVIHTVTTNSTA